MRKFLAPALAAATAVGAVGYSTSASAQSFPFGNSGSMADIIGLAIGVLGSGQNRSYSPYGSQYPYGSYPYGSQQQYPYGAQYPQYPYGQQSYGYGVSPYGQSPYGQNPYGYGYNCRNERVWDSYYRRYVYRQVC